MKIAITGDKGFVGRHFHKYFSNWPEAEITGIDLQDGKDCRDFFKECKERFELVIHLAAIVGGRMTIEGNPLKVATDLQIDSCFWQWVVATKQPRVVYFSSSAAYPTRLQVKGMKYTLKEQNIDLESVGTPDMSYGWAKLTGELQAQYAKDAGTAVHILRPFSGYGTDQALDYPFPSFIDRIKSRVSEFEIWGDGTQTRDFIHIDDVVGATMAAIDQDYQDPLNICTGVATSFNDLYKQVCQINKVFPKVKHLLDKPVGVHYRVGNPTNMYKLYTPKIPLSWGIRMALKGE